MSTATPAHSRDARPRILFVSTVYPTPWEPHKGPANRSTVESLRLAGCDVSVVAPVPWIKRLGKPSRVAPEEHYPIYWYPPRAFRAQYHRTMQWSIGATLRRVSRDFRPDAVLAFWTDPDGTVAVNHARMLDVPSGVIVGGSDVMLLPANAARRRVIAATLAAADHVFAVGSVLKEKVIALGASPERVSIFISGLDLTRFKPGDRRQARQRLGLPSAGPVLLWIGHMVPVKATERVLRAAVALTKEVPDLQVVLIGDGPRRGALAAEVDAEPALHNRVMFIGTVDHAELPDWYRAADLLVLPSRSEGVPNVLLEAMACGLPFVASDVGSIAGLLPFGPSQVVTEGDETALTAAISASLGDRSQPVVPRQYDRQDAAHQLLRELRLT